MRRESVGGTVGGSVGRSVGRSNAPVLVVSACSAL